jgi:hypothetical protein
MTSIAVLFKGSCGYPAAEARMKAYIGPSQEPSPEPVATDIREGSIPLSLFSPPEAFDSSSSVSGTSVGFLVFVSSSALIGFSSLIVLLLC